MPKSYLYWDNTPQMEGVKEVTVQPRSVRLKCEHKWMRRIVRRHEIQNGWRNICCKCGGLAR